MKTIKERFEDDLAAGKVKLSHTSTSRGYMSRKGGTAVETYLGKYGKGYTVHSPNWESTLYHYKTYYIEG